MMNLVHYNGATTIEFARLRNSRTFQLSMLIKYYKNLVIFGNTIPYKK